MKQMVYTTRTKKAEILATGIYKNFKYYVISYGAYPCAYVDVSNTSLASTDYDEINIDCHGGLTYSEDYLSAADTEKSDGKWYIGWDYAHYGDYTFHPFHPYIGGGEWDKRWTTEEIVAECKNVINQIVDEEGVRKL